MDIKRFATLIFNAFVWLAFSTLLILFLRGIYLGIQSEKPQEPEAVEYIEPVEVVEPVTTSEEESEVVVTESEVVVLSCSVVETPDTAQSEPSEAVQPVTLYDVPLDANLQRFIIGKAEEIGIDPAVIFAMAYRESSYNPDAIGDNGNSFGMLQIQPRWNMERMKRLGCMDLLDPYQTVTVATDLLGELMGKYGDVAVALTVYNYGHFPGYVTEYATDVLNTAEELAVTE